jgi:predicted ATPase/DNA-binding SARP family transcriptional activator
MPAYLRLLGRPRAEHAGASVVLPVERRCQLLLHLALRRDWVARSELAALFWPAHRADLAATNLRKALHLARALPWAAALETQGDAVRFAIATDLQEVGQAVREGRVADALQRCEGTLLDGMDDTSNAAWTEWLDIERAQHQRRWHELTRARMQQLEGSPGEAAAFASRLLEVDALDEDAVVALLAAQRALGQFDRQRESYAAFAARLSDDLGVEPSARVRKLRSDVAVHRPAVPADADGFFGRAHELEELAALLARDECRLLTVIGPGGAGKSSLAKRALRQLEPRFPDGAYWIALDDLHDIAQVTARIAAELDLALNPQQQPLPRVCEHLAQRRVLLMLDNGEHLDELARLIERLQGHAPQLKICATSRVRLGVRGEWLLPLDGLALAPPDAPEREILSSDAARLFVSAARAVRPDFTPHGQSRAIDALLQATGGLPLAILLAANWVRLLPVAEIGAELERSLDLLESADDGEERPEHRSVRATFEQSWQRLATSERDALAALAVFVGSFARPPAKEVANAALPLLAALADKSLLQISSTGRCALHPLIRQFAREKLDRDTLATVRHRHAQYFHRLLARLTPAAQAADQSALDEIGADLENCRLAWRWAIEHRAAEGIAASAPALKEYFNVRGRVAEGLELLEEARTIAEDGEPGSAAVLLAAIAQTQYRLSRLDDAAARARRGIRHARTAGPRTALVRCLSVLGTCCWQWGRHAEAQRVLQQAVRQAEANADTRGKSLALHNLALVEKALGNHARAAALMNEWLISQRQLRDWLRVAMGLNNLAYVHQAQGDWAQAQRCLDEALALCDEHDLSMPRPALLANLSHNLAASGRLDEAENVSRRLAVDARSKGLSDVEATALNQLVRVAILRTDYASALARLRDAIARAVAIRIEYVQIDCVLSFARIAAGTGDAGAAAPLLRYLLARPDLEPVDRAQAEACLQRLPASAGDAPVPDLALEALVRNIATRLDPAQHGV